jgi:hypothetical protein
MILAKCASIITADDRWTHRTLFEILLASSACSHGVSDLRLCTTCQVSLSVLRFGLKMGRIWTVVSIRTDTVIRHRSIQMNREFKVRMRMVLGCVSLGGVNLKLAMWVSLCLAGAWGERLYAGNADTDDARNLR